jgi:hypothetical protein
MLCRRPSIVIHSLRAQQPGAPIDRQVSGGVTGLMRSEHLASMGQKGQSFGSMQVRILSRRYSSSCKP